MIVLNFSHPFTTEQLNQLDALLGHAGQLEVRHIPAQFGQQKDFDAQVRDLADLINLSPEDWQTQPILVNPPAYSYAAVVLLAELHGRMGYFPSIIRIRPIPESTPPRYEVAEIINLQSVREKARQTRS
jgi:hypothetical protein